MDDSIRRRGENISSYDIERIIDEHPKVLESAAIGVPSEVGESEVKIVVVAKAGETIDPVDLVRFCATRMAHFMVPKYVEFAVELPKTPNGKVQKQKLRALGVTPQTWDREAAGIRLKSLLAAESIGVS